MAVSKFDILKKVNGLLPAAEDIVACYVLADLAYLAGGQGGRHLKAGSLLESLLNAAHEIEHTSLVSIREKDSAVAADVEVGLPLPAHPTDLGYKDMETYAATHHQIQTLEAAIYEAREAYGPGGSARSESISKSLSLPPITAKELFSWYKSSASYTGDGLEQGVQKRFNEKLQRSIEHALIKRVVHGIMQARYDVYAYLKETLGHAPFYEDTVEIFGGERRTVMTLEEALTQIREIQRDLRTHHMSPADAPEDFRSQPWLTKLIQVYDKITSYFEGGTTDWALHFARNDFYNPSYLRRGRLSSIVSGYQQSLHNKGEYFTEPLEEQLRETVQGLI